MPFTPTIINSWPVVNASASVWGGILNDRGGETYTDIQAIATVLNATETLANNALSRAGGTMTGDIVVASVAPTSVNSVGYRGSPVRNVTGNTSIVVTDAGHMVRTADAANTQWTIQPNGIEPLPIGSVIVVRNAGTGSVSLVRGTGVQLRIAGNATDGNKTITPSGYGILTQEALNVWIASGAGVA